MHQTSDLTIFIVEDNPLYQQLIARELESFGGRIHFYSNGENCVDHLYLRPGIIILDYDLDGDMNGLDTLAEIRAFDPAIFVMLFSNRKGLDTNENISRYGSFDFLEKQDKSFSMLKHVIRTKLV